MMEEKEYFGITSCALSGDFTQEEMLSMVKSNPDYFFTEYNLYHDVYPIICAKIIIDILRKCRAI